MNGNKWRIGVWVWPIVVLMIYCLSAGPIMSLASNGANVPLQISQVIYEPIVTLGLGCPPLKHFLTWYVGLWGVPIRP